MPGFSEAARRLCGAAAALLGWRPEEFWSATPEELATCLCPEGRGEAPDRSEIEALLQRFPD